MLKFWELIKIMIQLKTVFGFLLLTMMQNKGRFISHLKQQKKLENICHTMVFRTWDIRKQKTDSMNGKQTAMPITPPALGLQRVSKLCSRDALWSLVDSELRRRN